MILKEAIKKAALNFIGSYYSESEENACYDIDLMSEEISECLKELYPDFKEGRG